MIGQIYKQAAGFRDAFQYLNGAIEPAPALTFTCNLPTEDVRVAEIIMSAFGRGFGRTATPAYRFRIFFHPSDNPDAVLARRIAVEILADMEADEFQAVIGYFPGDRPHLYVVLNRVHPQHRNTWSPWHDMRRMMKCLRRLEREHDLHVVVPQPHVGRAEDRHASLAR